MLFCPFRKNLDSRLLDDYTLGLRSFFKSGKITEKISKYRYYRYFFDISISVFFQYRNSLHFRRGACAWIVRGFCVTISSVYLLKFKIIETCLILALFCLCVFVILMVYSNHIFC